MAHMNREELLKKVTELARSPERLSHYTNDEDARVSESWWKGTLDDGSIVQVGLVAWKQDILPDGSMHPKQARLIHVVDGVKRIESFRCDQTYVVDRSAERLLGLRMQLKALCVELHQDA